MPIDEVAVGWLLISCFSLAAAGVVHRAPLSFGCCEMLHGLAHAYMGMLAVNGTFTCAVEAAFEVADECAVAGPAASPATRRLHHAMVQRGFNLKTHGHRSDEEDLQLGMQGRLAADQVEAEALQQRDFTTYASSTLDANGTSNGTDTDSKQSAEGSVNDSANSTNTSNGTEFHENLTIQEGLATLYTKSGDDSFLLMDITKIVRRPGPAQVLVTAMAARGVYVQDGGQVMTLHEPLENTQNTMLNFSLSSNGKAVDIMQPLTHIRTSDNQTRKALEMGMSSPTAARLDCEKRTGSPEGCTPTSVIINGFDLIKMGFFVTDFKDEEARLVEVKAYPQNIDVTVEYMTEGMGRVTFSMAALPERPMAPRPNDERLGYFAVSYTDFGLHKQKPNEKRSKAVDREVSTIWRYNIDAMPDRRLKVYVDPSVPARWRKYFKEGIEAWNVAFGEIGYEQALRAVLPGDPDWPEDYDAGDARFSTIAWSMDMEEVYSLGIARVDPRSGEILKGDILMTHGWVRTWLDDLDAFVPSEKLGSGYHREERTSKKSEASKSQRALRRHRERSGNPSHAFQANFLELQRGSNKSQPDDTDWDLLVLGAGLRSVVMHEMGHLLGLRHNFKGSLGVTWECTQNKSCSVNESTTASVMDYLPMNLPLDGDYHSVHIFPPAIGAYDRLAIRYGYAKEDPTYPEMLDEVLQHAEIFQVCLDGNREGLDPLCVADDLSAEPLRYYEGQLDLASSVLHRLLHDAVAPGQAYMDYGDAVLRVMQRSYEFADRLLVWIGGVNVSFTHRGYDGEPGRPALQPIGAADQRKALDLLLRLLRPRSSGLLPPDDEAARFLVISDPSDDGATTLDLREEILQVRREILQDLLSSKRLMHMYEYDFDTSQSETSLRLGYGDLLEELTSGIMSEANFSGAVEPREWNLQISLADCLNKLHNNRDLPQEVAAHVSFQMQKTRVAAGRALESLKQQEQQEPNGESSELLRVHLLLLRERLKPRFFYDELLRDRASGLDRGTVWTIAAWTTLGLAFALALVT